MRPNYTLAKQIQCGHDDGDEVMVMELVSKNVSLRGSMGRMLYADDLAVVVKSGWEMQEVLGEWKEAFGKNRLEDEYGED